MNVFNPHLFPHLHVSTKTVNMPGNKYTKSVTHITAQAVGSLTHQEMDIMICTTYSNMRKIPIVIDGPNLNSLCSSKNVDILVADDFEIRNLAVKRQKMKKNMIDGTYNQ